MHFRLDDNHGAQFLGPVSYLKSTRSIDKFETNIPWKFFQLMIPNNFFFWLILNISAGFSETNRDLLRADRHSGSSFVISKADTSNRSEVIGRAKILFTIKKNHLYNLEKSCPLKNLENNVNRQLTRAILVKLLVEQKSSFQCPIKRNHVLSKILNISSITSYWSRQEPLRNCGKSNADRKLHFMQKQIEPLRAIAHN